MVVAIVQRLHRALVMALPMLWRGLEVVVLIIIIIIISETICNNNYISYNNCGQVKFSGPIRSCWKMLVH